MKVRPIFWYLLTATLVLAMALGCMRHIAAIVAYNNQDEAALMEEKSHAVEKTDTVDFLAELIDYAQATSVTLERYDTMSLEGDSYSCQIVACGAYNDLAALLGWLEKAQWVHKVNDFELAADDGASELLLKAEVVLSQ